MEDRILIADDEEQIRNILYKLLTKKGYEVKSIANGSKITGTVKSFHPHVLLLDQCMPEMDGMELAQKISNIEGTTRKILLHSSADSLINSKNMSKYGIDSKLEKPVKQDDLFRMLNRLKKRDLTNLFYIFNLEEKLDNMKKLK